MRLTILSIIIILFVSTGFQDSPSAKKDKITYSLEAGGVKSWKSTSQPSPYAGYVDFFTKDGQPFLVMENRNNTSVEFYPWNAGSLLFAVKPDSAEVPECYMQGFYIASMDSVFILDAGNGKLHLLNKKGMLVKTHSLESGTGTGSKTQKLMPGIYSGSPGIQKGDWLHISGTPFSGASDPSTYSHGKTNIAVNMQTGATRTEYGYPNHYKEGKYSAYYKDVKRCLTPEGELLYSFGADDSVRLTDLQTPGKAFYAGSSFFKTPPPAKAAYGNTARPQNYGGILYDKVNQVYYRMALHGVADVLKAEHGFDDQQISIIILDKNFRKTGETLLPAGKHNFRQWFTGPDGLYISNSHPGQLSGNTGELAFTRYKLVPAKK